MNITYYNYNYFDEPINGNIAIYDLLPTSVASDATSDTKESVSSYSTIENIDNAFQELKRMNVLWPLKNAIDVNGELIYEFIFSYIQLVIDYRLNYIP